MNEYIGLFFSKYWQHFIKHYQIIRYLRGAATLSIVRESCNKVHYPTSFANLARFEMALSASCSSYMGL